MSTTTQTTFRRIPAPQSLWRGLAEWSTSEGWVSEPLVQNRGVISWQRARYARGVRPTDPDAAPVECEIGFKNGVVIHYGGTANHLVIYRNGEQGRQILRQLPFECRARVFPLLLHRSAGSEYGILVRVDGYQDQVISAEGTLEVRYRRAGNAGSEWVRACVMPATTGSFRVEGLAMTKDQGRMRRVRGRVITAEHVYMDDGTNVRLFVTPRHVAA